ncbi:Transmembrane alpha-helix domain protein [Rutstroemia sp. NJR-2017a BVV2]|nr:Transmembrane alpha-helix domain protein [Rutstroemia sp. NJR-2017a BVV2]
MINATLDKNVCKQTSPLDPFVTRSIRVRTMLHIYKPCNGSAPVSMCCLLGYGTSHNGGDQCGSGSTYGLCGVTGTQLWRESCTDQTWQSPVCLKLCVGGNRFAISSAAANDTAITACPDGSYCCGKNAMDCCNAGQGKFIVNNQVADLAADNSSTIDASSSSSMSIEVETTTGPLTTYASVSTNMSSISGLITTIYPSLPATTSQSLSIASGTSESHPLTTGAQAGIAVGAGMFVITVLALAAFFSKWKLGKIYATERSLDSEKTVVVEGDVRSRRMHGNSVEADSVSRPAEMGDGRRGEPIEML